ncbi:IS1182 family transposase [Virgibacillus halodenitrificans]|uniref:IS1182 family transposase n=1 Tax=Virgibacillus halodenitrificans TaxID=1482 RepID=UPI00136C0493|nr:IS1182 family transposase [Virgibacillus halodenitrificans]MYL47035.1 IS1182 family transposase [Virgibacillus halodenitrificans]
MIEQQTSLILSPYAELYDKLIPKDNFLRRINELVDFSFILEKLQDRYCRNNGRNAVHPIRMFKYLLLKQIYDVSDVDIVERSKTDLALKYFLDMAPEDDVINPSSLTKFRKLRIEPTKEEWDKGEGSLLDDLIQKTVEVAIEQGVIESKTIIVDATHTTSRYCAKSASEYLKEKAKLVRKTAYKFDASMKEKFPEKPTGSDINETREYCEKMLKVIEKEEAIKGVPAVKEKVNYLQEVLTDCQTEATQSSDPDARIGHKSQDHAFFGYKSHLAVTKERIITAASVTTGEKSDGKYLKTLVNKSRAAGMDVDTVIGDTAYSGTDNLTFAQQEGNFQFITKLHPVITNGKRNEDDGFEFNKDADMFACPAGHLAVRKRIKRRKAGDNRNHQMSYYFDVGKCKKCPLQAGCYNGTKIKSYSVTVKAAVHAEHEKFQETELFKTLAKDRYIVEAKNGELKNQHGYDQASNSGLLGMELQSATTIFVVNLKRILKLIDQK